jgi:hypothetical protein
MRVRSDIDAEESCPRGRVNRADLFLGLDIAAWMPLQPPQSRARNILYHIWLTLCPLACVGVAVLGTQSQSVAVVVACSVVAMTLSILMAVSAWRRVTLSLWTKIASLIIAVAMLELPLRLLWMIPFP